MAAWTKRFTKAFAVTVTSGDIGRAPVVIGGGIAGLMTALRLAPMPVVVLAKAPLQTEASSAWAQGGVAAALGSDDSPGLHHADTLAAGAGLCDADVARRVTMAGPAAIEILSRYGARFDSDPAGTPRLGLEAAHARRRIVHATGDGTGKEIMRALVAAVRQTPSITVQEGVEARRLLVGDGAISGVLAAAPSGAMVLPTSRVVLATGGVGGLFLHTTNPRGAFGQGLALAARAGAALVDMEFVQFHPTALDVGGHPLTLVSEAVRGEGATLIDEMGRRFMADVPRGELAPRDVVARAVWRHLDAGHRVFLDARAALGGRFARHFPAIAAACAAAGIDPARQPIPVRPAAHYHMGGVTVDGDGRSTLPGLWASGEVAGTGLHGANRLASNSLLEAVVCAGWVADSVAAAPTGRPGGDVAAEAPAAADAALIRPVLSRAAGVLREASVLAASLCSLMPLVDSAGSAADPALVALLIVVAAWRRRESRGAHFRSDFPTSDAVLAQRMTMTLKDAIDDAHEVVATASDFSRANERFERSCALAASCGG
ncbi:MAG TPA: L-aspartate oxidase [Rhodopila sp.]